MMLYRCNKTFTLPMYDDDGNLIENERLPVIRGTVWERSDDENLLGGEIHLENRMTGEWIEITEERLNEYFSPKEGEQE